MTASSEPSPRLQPGNLRNLGPINWAISKVIAVGAGTKEANLFTTLGQAGGLFRTWLLYSANLLAMGKFSRYETEMVILRVAHLRNCDYERDHHVRLGRKAGIDKETLAKIEEGPGAGWPANHRALLATVDQLVENKAVSEVVWTTFAEHYSRELQVELLLLVTQYDGLATVIGTLGIELDSRG